MKPNVGFEPTTFRFQVDKFAVSILKLAPLQGFEPQNVGIKIRCLRPTWRKGYNMAAYFYYFNSGLNASS